MIDILKQLSEVLAQLSVMLGLLTNPMLSIPDNQYVFGALESVYQETLTSFEVQKDRGDEGFEKATFSKILPEMTLGKWDDEVQMKVFYQKVNTTGVKNTANEIEWQQGNEKVRAYPLIPTSIMENGGYEFEIELASKPTTNVFNFHISGIENLDFFYQAPLWQEKGLNAPTQDCTDTKCTILGTSYRPENVVGSYAVYHKTKSNHKIGDKNYKVGKAFHIYRPKAIDVNGVEIWADLNINETQGILKVTVPQKFLDEAVYPVRVDPTFGFTSVGASEDDAYNNFVWFKASTTPASSGTLDSISMYGRTLGNVEQSPSIYSDSAGLPANRLAALNGSGATSGTNTWLTSSISYSGITSGVQYWLGAGQGSNADSNNDVFWKYDTTSGNILYYKNNGGEGTAWPDPVGTINLGSVSERGSIYGTYTASGEGVPPPIPQVIIIE